LVLRYRIWGKCGQLGLMEIEITPITKGHGGPYRRPLCVAVRLRVSEKAHVRKPPAHRVDMDGFADADALCLERPVCAGMTA
jgi:hypothetical protein